MRYVKRHARLGWKTPEGQEFKAPQARMPRWDQGFRGGSVVRTRDGGCAVMPRIARLLERANDTVPLEPRQLLRVLRPELAGVVEVVVRVDGAPEPLRERDGPGLRAHWEPSG